MSLLGSVSGAYWSLKWHDLGAFVSLVNVHYFYFLSIREHCNHAIISFSSLKLTSRNILNMPSGSCLSLLLYPLCRPTSVTRKPIIKFAQITSTHLLVFRVYSLRFDLYLLGNRRAEFDNRRSVLPPRYRILNEARVVGRMGTGHVAATSLHTPQLTIVYSPP